MKKLHIILPVFLLTLFSACEDYVDIKPKGQTIVESLADIDALLQAGNSLSGGGGNSDVISLLSDNVQVTDEDLDFLTSNNMTRPLKSMYLLDDLFYQSNELDESWEIHYGVIGRCNHILNALEELSGDEGLSAQYKAEALVHRAHAYWRLVNIFGVHYGEVKAAEEGSGIPLLTQYGNTEESLIRASVNDVYKQMVDDLEDAIPDLLPGRPNISRINTSAAQALMARVQLHMGNYSSALEYADKVLEVNSNLYNYNFIPPIPFPPGYALLPRTSYNPEFVLFKHSNMPVVYNGKGIVPPFACGLGMFSDELTALYTDKTNDLRISKVAEMVGDKYAIGYNMPVFFPPIGVTVPELLLIKAEALAREASRWSEAMAEVNTLRSNRFAIGSAYELTAASQEEAIQNVIDERRREFHITGMRFFDIKRLNALHNAGISLTRKDKTWNANSINWAIPIGQKMIDTGGGELMQNPRE
ncbi:MAG: RagB/SusD family nutrient uptake outer membrane protein [Carboxylicivirga sp.]|jgi:tetratricopeptide (TPR) repeat protein|nr:RagB/SusD family nutrient uptake outer membrane protein [Carboxylicivirga sp.]